MKPRIALVLASAVLAVCAVASSRVRARGAVPPQDAALLQAARAAVSAAPTPTVPLTIEYPRAATLFPPDMIAPTFLFRDRAAAASRWFVALSVAGEPDRFQALTDGSRPEEEIDPRCGPRLESPEETAARISAKSWTPDAALWRALTTRPDRDITAEIYGLAGPGLGSATGRIDVLSRGTVTFRISADPVGAPIFYRDVPLMPTTNDKGLVMPLAEGALPLIEWRLRDLSRPSAPVVLEDMPTCANCHSFSRDGKVLGMDMDGPAGDKGAYALAPVEPRMVVGNDRVMSWNAFDPRTGSYGLFSRISPDGRYVVSSVREKLFVTNYMDFRFLQTFYPTEGILAVHDRRTGRIASLPGADDPGFVQSNADWTPDGSRLVFIRAKAASNVPSGPPPVRANDPNEVRIRYDLYTIPFAEGRGGEARPIPGASDNGRSNSFPKVSPDGRWIVWVQAGNGLLMRPDSELFIMPLAGGAPRRMSCNMSPMNSWHSWSPNGRWLVFSSKAGSPYTRMYLTHIDDQGNDSPPVLVPNSTAANRAVNLPEFVALGPGGLLSIDVPAVDYRRHLDRAAVLVREKDLAGAYGELRTADEMRPGFPDTLAALGFYFRESGDAAKAVEYFEKALAIDPRNWAAHNFYGATLFRQGRYEEALAHFQAAIEANPLNAQGQTNLGVVEFSQGRLAEAKGRFERALIVSPSYVKARFNLALILVQEKAFNDAAAHYELCLRTAPDDAATLGNLAWLYATCPDEALRNGRRALVLGRKLDGLSPRKTPRLYDILGAALAESGEFGPAVEAAGKALELTLAGDPAAGLRRRLIDLYRTGRAYREGL